MKIIKNIALATCLISVHAYAMGDIPMKQYDCSSLPVGQYDVSSFGTQAEREVDPRVKDISQFYITQIDKASGFVNGYVILPNNNKATFTAKCEPKYYQDPNTQAIYPEIYLIFKSDQSGNPTQLDNCSGIFNFAQPSQSVGSAMYIGAPSLITGDGAVSVCVNNAYGTITPPSPAVKDYNNN